MAIRVENLSYIYQPDTPFQRVALQDINITIEDGEFVGILGASGSGKSTFLQTLNGSLVTKDSVYLDHLAIGDKKTTLLDIVAKAALAFQYPEQQIFCDTVEEEIGFGCGNLGRSPGEVKRAVEKYSAAVGLDRTYFLRSPFELSGGEKRRVALASVLAMDTPILLLDEPTVALDAGGRKGLGRLIKALNLEEGRTVLWVGHNLGEIAALASRLVVFYKGRIVLDGPTEEILSQKEKLEAFGIVVGSQGSVTRGLAEKFGNAYKTQSGRRIDLYLQGEDNQ